MVLILRSKLLLLFLSGHGWTLAEYIVIFFRLLDGYYHHINFVITFSPEMDFVIIFSPEMDGRRWMDGH